MGMPSLPNWRTRQCRRQAARTPHRHHRQQHKARHGGGPSQGESNSRVPGLVPPCAEHAPLHNPAMPPRAASARPNSGGRRRKKSRGHVTRISSDSSKCRYHGYLACPPLPPPVSSSSFPSSLPFCGLVTRACPRRIHRIHVPLCPPQGCAPANAWFCCCLHALCLRLPPSPNPPLSRPAVGGGGGGGCAGGGVGTACGRA